MQYVDLSGRKFGRLEVVGRAGAYQWECVCKKGHHTTKSTSKLFVKTPRCSVCNPRPSDTRQLKLNLQDELPQTGGAPASEFIREYERFRASFTPAQRDRYDELMAGRKKNATNESQAVDVVMREPVPGRCCARCAQEIDVEQPP